MPQDLPVYSRCAYVSSKLTYGDDINISAARTQQRDPMSGLEFCESIQPTLLDSEARTEMGIVDDINSEGDTASVARNVRSIIDSYPSTGFLLNII